MKIIKEIGISESDILPFVSGEDQFVRDFLDEAYPVIIAERSYGGSPESTNIIDPSARLSVNTVCHNIRIYLTQLNIIAISYPHITSTTKDAIEIVRGFCNDILKDPNIFRHCGESKMLAVMSAQRWMMYLDSIGYISRQCERVDSYNQGLKSWENEIMSFITVERLQKEIRISENGSAVFEGDYCFIQDWFQKRFGLNFNQARSIVFSSEELQYPEDMIQIDGLPKTLDDFFQQIVGGIKEYIHEFFLGDDGRQLTLQELELKIENILGQFSCSSYGAVYDLPETQLMLKIRIGFMDVLETNNYLPRPPSF